ncbi:MAG: CoA-binding protein [Verrucomicrobia bacterium]|nr:CoA-binding protein [Verrucomicrobiota bacterium]
MHAIVLGASTDSAKFGNKAVRAFLQAGWTVTPVNPNAEPVAGLPAVARLGQLEPGTAAVLSVYLPPRVTVSLADEIAAVAPGEVWLNPGADAPEVVEALQQRGLRTRELCSIVELGYVPAMFP